MIFRYKDFLNELSDENPVSFIVMESVQTYTRFFAHLESTLNHDSEHFSIISNGNVQKLDRVLEWVQNNWCLENIDRKMLNSLYSQLEKEFLDTNEGQEIIAAWYRFQDQIADLLAVQGYVAVPESIVSLTDIFKSYKVYFRELPKDNYLNRLQEYLTRMQEHSSKRIFLFENLLSYLDRNDLIEIYTFCEREELCIVDIESHFRQDVIKGVGRVLVVDQDLCELVIVEP